MKTIFKNQTADINSVDAHRVGIPGTPGLLFIEVVGTWTGSLKVKARLMGSPEVDYVDYLGITRVSDGSEIAGNTGITGSGLYVIDLAGLEARFELDMVTGSVTVRTEGVAA